ncbi:phage tail tape measure protein, partial [Bacillus sp. HC-Mk]
YVKYEEDEGKGSRFLRQAGLAWNKITNTFSPGHPDVDSFDVGLGQEFLGEKGGFKGNFENWIKREYGTSNWKEALEKENEKRANDAKSKGQDGNYSKASLTDLTQSYLNQSGMYAKKQQLEKEEFIDQYRKSAISESEQNMRRDEAEKARKAWENKMIDEGQYDYFSYDDLKSRIQESQKVASNKGGN